MSCLVLCGFVKPHAMNSHFLLLPALTANCPHQLQQFCLGHAAEEGPEGTFKVGPAFGGPTRKANSFSIRGLVLGALLPCKGPHAWDTRMLRVIDFFPWPFSHARAKTSLSLLTTGWKKQ